MLITREDLLAHGAQPDCEDLKKFDAEWPGGVEVTKKNALRAAELELPVGWFARAYLEAPAQERFERDTAEAWKRFNRDTAPARKQYNRDRAPAQERLNKSFALALCEILKAEEK